MYIPVHRSVYSCKISEFLWLSLSVAQKLCKLNYSLFRLVCRLQNTMYLCFRDGCGIIMVIFTQVFFIALVSSSIIVVFTQGVAVHYPSHSASSVLSMKVKVVRALHYANIDGVASMDYHGQFNGLHPEYRAVPFLYTGKYY